MLVTGARNKRMCPISDQKIGKKILGINSNLFHTLSSINTVVGIMGRGKDFECGFYAQLFIIDIRIGNELFCGEGR